jgi:hypothetical protein
MYTVHLTKYWTDFIQNPRALNRVYCLMLFLLLLLLAVCLPILSTRSNGMMLTSSTLTSYPNIQEASLYLIRSLSATYTI